MEVGNYFLFISEQRNEYNVVEEIILTKSYQCKYIFFCVYIG